MSTLWKDKPGGHGFKIQIFGMEVLCGEKAQSNPRKIDFVFIKMGGSVSDPVNYHMKLGSLSNLVSLMVS